MSDKKIAIIAVVISGILGSAVAAVMKKGLIEIPPYSYNFLRFLLASLCVLPFFIYQKGHKISNLKELAPVSLFATFNILFFVVGLNLTTANVGSVIYAAVPLLVSLISYLLFKERLSKEKDLGIIIGFVGVLLITLLPLLERGNPFAGNMIGNILLTCAITSWSFYMVFVKKLQSKYSPFIITCNFIFVTTIVSLPFIFWDLQHHFGWWQNVSWWGILSLFYIAVIITIINYMLNQYAIKHGGTILAAMMFYIMPVLGFGFNFFLLGEILTPGFVFGSVLALIGTYLVVRK